MDLLRRLFGHQTPTTVADRTKQPKEDDWERERRKRREEALEQEYAARVQRIEDEYHVQRQKDDQK